MGGFPIDGGGLVRVDEDVKEGMEPSGDGCSWVKVRSLVRELRKASAWGLSLNAPRPSSTK